MTTAPQPAAPRRRFRFGLRTLLAVVTLAAVASWGYWIGWPWWLVHREQMKFEESVGQIKIGMTPSAASKLVDWKSRITTNSVAFDSQHNPIELTKYVWPNAIYCIYYEVPIPKDGIPSNGACSSVEVFSPSTCTGFLSGTHSKRSQKRCSQHSAAQARRHSDAWVHGGFARYRLR